MRQSLVPLLALLAPHVLAQTYSACNPMTQQGCPNDPAIANYTWNFANGQSPEFTAAATAANIAYTNGGVQLSIKQSGDAPTLVSQGYFLYGKVSVSMMPAPGVGVVSSLVMLSDSLDEIDWEWLGAQSQEVQTNYYGKGYTGDYNRSTTVDVNGLQTHTYTVDWQEGQIDWYIDGTLVRTLLKSQAVVNGVSHFPQTPMQYKIGPWAAGDPSNAPGTVQWAGGDINYADGPFTMQVFSISIENYTPASAYQWIGSDGDQDSVQVLAGTGSTGSAAGVNMAVLSNTTSSSTTSSSSSSSSSASSNSSMTSTSSIMSNTTATLTSASSVVTGMSWNMTNSTTTARTASSTLVFSIASTATVGPAASVAAASTTAKVTGTTNAATRSHVSLVLLLATFFYL